MTTGTLVIVEVGLSLAELGNIIAAENTSVWLLNSLQYHVQTGKYFVQYFLCSGLYKLFDPDNI